MNPIIIVGIVGCLAIAIITAISFLTNKPKYENFSQALTDTGILIVEAEPKPTHIPKNTPVMIIHKRDIFSKMLQDPELGFTETYMQGDWSTPDLYLLMKHLDKNEQKLVRNLRQRYNILNILNIFMQQQFKAGTTKETVKHHYDISNKLYQKMLGGVMAYTCAYYYKPTLTLEEAQVAKFDLIASKLKLKPGMKVLDIGCGFGAFAVHIAKKYGCKVFGCTLSEAQKQYYDENLQMDGVEILLEDYRSLKFEPESFDRIVSIGFFEAIGVHEYKKYFNICKKALRPDGLSLLQTIGTNSKAKRPQSKFIAKYIFPGGELPFMRDIIKASNDDWFIEDWQNFGLSYARTLTEWRNNIGDWSGLEEFPESFRRMWDLYLIGFRINFEIRAITLWQTVFSRRDNPTMIDLNEGRCLHSNNKI